MKKIGDVTSTADKNGEWTNGNVAAGIAPTILEAGWLNSVQREILGVLVEAGIAQDKNNDNQLKDAIKKIISGGNYATKTEVNSKLAKDQNGADIPDKPKFIENLGLGDANGFVGRLIKTRFFTSSGTYTPTPGTKRIRVTITGGGGGGGGCQALSVNETYLGGGGGAGGTIISTMTLTKNEYPVVVGAGGTGSHSAETANDGGDSSFASLIAYGGKGGFKDGILNTSGGVGGLPTTGDICISGGCGQDGLSGSIVIGGCGGASYWGGGGRSGTGYGVSGLAYGSGGGAAYDPAFTNTSMKGGDGASGICIIEEFA